jgi:diaminopimelate epimerase
VLDAVHWPLAELTPALARALCDRHRGIGGDGVLWMGPAEQPGGDARLVILNADGSRPEMCGNGVRCVAAWLFDEGRLARDAPLHLETDAGLRPARVVDLGPADEIVVEVDMGPVRVAPEAVVLEAGGVRVRAIPVDVGNPHAVVFDPVPEDARMNVVRAAEARGDVWPQGVNVEFAAGTAVPGFEVRVHERGVGWTQACGTGACAVAAAAVASAGTHGHIPSIRVALEGGTLEVRVTHPGNALRTFMRGPARRAFEGTVRAPAREARNDA